MYFCKFATLQKVHGKTISCLKLAEKANSNYKGNIHDFVIQQIKAKVIQWSINSNLSTLDVIESHKLIHARLEDRKPVHVKKLKKM